MKKSKLIAGLLILIILIGTVPAMATDASVEVTAKISPQKIYVNGQRVELLAYSINDNNYVRLRDIGKAVDFSVSYDAAADSVQIDRKYGYTGEITDLPIPGENPVAIPSEQKIFVSEKPVQMTAYNITDNNYVKLRDIGGAINLGMAYDPDADAVYIDRQMAYIPNMSPELLRPEAIPIAERTDEPTIVDNTIQSGNKEAGETIFLTGEIDLIIKRLPEEYNAVKPFVDELNSMPSNRERINAIVRYVCERMTYGEAEEGTYTRIGHNASGNETRSMRYVMFLDAPPVKGWCFHYSKAVDFLCILSGVPTVMIESYKSDHAWNAVYADGNWYYVDATNATAKLKLYPDADILMAMDTPNLPFADDSPESTRERMEQLVSGSTK